jgi:hypothetical protein
MKVYLLVLPAVLCGLSLCGAGVALADITWISEISDGQSSKTVGSYLGEHHMRVEVPDGAHVYFFDGEAQKITSVDTSRKTYMEMDKAQLDRLRAMRGGAVGQAQGQGTMDDARRAKLEARIASLPPDQQQMMRQAMAGQMGGAPAAPSPGAPDYHFQSLGEKKTVAGFSCEMYHITDGGRVVEEACLSAEAKKLIKPGDLKVLREFMDLVGTAGPAGQAQGIMAQMEKYPGFPVQTVRTLPDGRKVTQTLKSLVRGAIAADTFAVPSGLTKEERRFPGPR